MGLIQISLLIVIFAVNLQNGSAEHCVQCVHLDFFPHAPRRFPNMYKNIHCKNYHPWVLKENSDDCPDDNKDYVCGTVKGNYTFDSLSVGEITVDAIVRRCVVPPQGLTDLDSGKSVCLKGNTLDKATNDIQLVGATPDFGDMTKFDGQVCYCRGNKCNAANSLGNNAVLVSILAATLAALSM
ncbi:uncharacterized protein LOC110988893 [Acanthaster planci]|uniref:Uncharacterized protein LOC110988893 n=1 Tax=Acanthaster planci TaxID=133434 RepID=A0A8B7ZSY7_ACAPL|nr:uncharacterized protein LOC110988893 [Acanthaster planci]